MSIASDALCYRLGGDVLLQIDLDNPKGAGNHCQWGVSDLGREIEELGGRTSEITTHDELCRQWASLRGFHFLRCKVV